MQQCWCRDADGCPGGFVTDAGVHYIAGLRLLTRAAGQPRMPVQCSSLQQPSCVGSAVMWQMCQGHRAEFAATKPDICLCSLGPKAAFLSANHVGLPAAACLSLSSLQLVRLDQPCWCHAGWGDAATACAHSRSVDPGLPAPDTVVSCLSYPNGCAASVSITFASPNSRFSLSVFGTEGSLEVRPCCGVTRIEQQSDCRQHVEALRV